MQVQELRQQRTRMLVTNLIYFIILLVVGIIMFFTNMGQMIVIPAVAAVIFYIAVARPLKKKYEFNVRETILKRSILNQLKDAQYLPKEGIKREYLTNAGFVNVIEPKSYLSREYICGSFKNMKVEMADVTFPIRENGLNKMFSGCLIHIENSSDVYTEVDVKAGDIQHLQQGREKNLVEKIGSFIPGSLYLHRNANSIDILLRARFIGFTVNPLYEVTESYINSEPLPEFKQALELAGIRKIEGKT